VLTFAIGTILVRVPFEVSEVLGNLLMFQTSPSAGQMMVDTFVAPHGPAGFLRTFSAATGKFLFDVSGGHYLLVYRAFHTALVLILLLSLAGLVKARSSITFGLAVLASLALVGGHTFHETVRETETNIKLIVPAMLMALFVLSASEPARWKGPVAVVAAFFGFFSNELGLLIWVSLVAAYLVGCRGVPRWALVAVTVILAGYFFLRFVQWGVGSPGLSERSSGFGFTRYDPNELIAMFGSNPYPFYAYNVLVSLLTVFFAEPRSGAFTVTRDVLNGSPQWGAILEVVTSTATTAVMAWFVARRFRHWFRLEFDDEDRLFLVAMAVIAANAVISFPYAKEVTMSSAGVFYALAMFPALRQWLEAMPGRAPFFRGALVYAAVICISVGWTVRGISFFVDMRRSAYRAQHDWVNVYEWLDSQHIQAPVPHGRALVDKLRTEAMAMDVPRLYLQPRWMDLIDPAH
jgi:hypothetical protein